MFIHGVFFLGLLFVAKVALPNFCHRFNKVLEKGLEVSRTKWEKFSTTSVTKYLEIIENTDSLIFIFSCPSVCGHVWATFKAGLPEL